MTTCVVNRLSKQILTQTLHPLVPRPGTEALGYRAAPKPSLVPLQDILLLTPHEWNNLHLSILKQWAAERLWLPPFTSHLGGHKHRPTVLLDVNFYENTSHWCQWWLCHADPSCKHSHIAHFLSNEWFLQILSLNILPNILLICKT